MRQGKLTRNFQGYSTHADCDLIGLGVTSIGKVGALYAQNHRELEAYYSAIDAGQLAIHRGVEIDAEDQIRAAIITQLMANYVLDVPALEARFGLRFAERFPRELEALERLRADGLVSVTPTQIEVAPRGKLLIRNVAMVFDRHRRPDEGSRFSKVI
jgi:oxygen-independent coproporphyrinogen-3 oxidase